MLQVPLVTIVFGKVYSNSVITLLQFNVELLVLVNKDTHSKSYTLLNRSGEHLYENRFVYNIAFRIT